MPSQIQAIAERIEQCLCADRQGFRRRLAHLQRAAAAGKPDRRAEAELDADIGRSRQRVGERAGNCPQLTFPAALPVVAARADIERAITDHQVVVICGETGSGKTTQLPKLCLALGRGAAGLIGHTQPRRIAARNVAARIAEELQSPLGGIVGYRVRFSDRTGQDARVKLMTDGILLAEIQHDRSLSCYDTLILDEAHERSLNIDFLLGYLKQLLPKRPDLKLIITSATIDPGRFSAFFDDAPVIEVSGRGYPVEVRYRPLTTQDGEAEDRDAMQALLDAVDELADNGPGDVLVFLSGEREIRHAAEALRKHHPPHTEILPLYARLSVTGQQRVFAPHTGRRLVLATNVAETSLTVPGIRYVVDTGLARISRYSYRTKVQRLPIERISQASANQRKGRCGRLGPGICIRLYDEADYNSRPAYTEPEILRTNLAAVILAMRVLGLGEVDDFPFIDPPDTRYINDGYRLLWELGAVDERRALTGLGSRLARLPIDPRLARMLLAAHELGSLTEVLVIAAALSVPDPRERPHDRQQQADEAHRRFHDPRSDFTAMLNIWHFYIEQSHQLSQHKLRKLCAKTYLSYVRLREWHDIHQQLRSQCDSMQLRANKEPADYEHIHRAVLAGLAGNIASRLEDRTYQGARDVRLSVFPGSGLFHKPPRWVVGAELVETGRAYLRSVAAIEPEWVERAVPHLVRHHYDAPHWELRSGRVTALERVTLYGLTLITQRRVNYAAIDPHAAREIFIRDGLVPGAVNTRGVFLRHNLALVGDIEDLEARARRRDVLVDSQALCDFYAARLPEDVNDQAGFERWRKMAERGNPRILFMRREDLIRHEAPAVTAERFPDELDCGGLRLKLSYHFEPGAADDGVTMTLPLAALNQVDEHCLDWLVPGLLTERVTGLIKTLPKSLRRHFVPAPDFAAACLAAIDQRQGDLQSLLARELQRMTGICVPADAWQPERLPEHLRMYLRIVDAAGNEVAAGRDLDVLRERLGGRAAQQFARSVPHSLERDGVTARDFGDLSEVVDIERDGQRLQAWPALSDTGATVAIRLYDNPQVAMRMHRAGLIRLIRLSLPQQYRYLHRHLPNFDHMCLLYQAVAAPADAAADQRPVPEALREELLATVTDRVFLQEGLIYSQHEFADRLERYAPQLVHDANMLCGIVSTVLSTAQSLRVDITALGRAQSRADLESQLSHLIYRGFIAATPPAWLNQLPRYLQAMRQRLDKLRQNPARDRRITAVIAPLWQRWLDSDRDAADDTLLQYRWMLEELRVSLFAQTLGTSCAVSVQRLERLWSGRRPGRGR